MPKKDGTVLRKHVEFLKKQGHDVSDFMPPPLPQEMFHIWSWFKEISLGRSSNGMSPNAIPYTEILAWSQLRGMRLGNFELVCLRELDILYLSRSANNG